MKLDLSCPIEVRGYVLSYAERGMQATARLYNLTTRRIASFEAVARWISAEDGRKIVCPFSMERVHACGESAFQITLDNHRLPDANRLEILFNTVRFEDGDTEWHAGNGPFAEMQPLPPMDAGELSMLRAAAGDDAVAYPRQDSQTWTCVCGRMNPNTLDSCARCHRDHFAALRHTPESVRNRRESAKAAEPPAEPVRLNRSAGRLRRTLFWTLAVLALTVFFVMKDQPANTNSTLNASAAMIETHVQAN